MLNYAVRRLLGAIPTLLVIITITFFMVRLAPGGPFDRERALPKDIEANLVRTYHLDEPLPVQLVRYLGGVLRGDFGPSFKYKDLTVKELIWGGFPVSAELGALAMLLAVTLGVALGSVAALRQNSGADYGVMAFAMTGIAIPNFVMAPILSLIFGVYLAWLPLSGWSRPSTMVLPVVALGLPQVAYVARMTRASLIEVMRANYIRTARAKGLPEWLTLTRHAMRGALLPVLSYLGPATAALITGSVVIETIFSIPGIGRYFVQGAVNRDYTLVLGVVVFYGALIIVFNLIVDLLYGLLDPRVRYD